MKTALYTLIILVFTIFSCNTENVAPDSDSLTLLDFPNCKLIEENFEASYGTTQNTFYTYEHSLLTRTDFYYNGKYNSTKLFIYDNNNVSHMLTSDSAETNVDTIASYIYEDNLLVKYTHFNTTNGNVHSANEYKYKNRKLIEISSTSEDGFLKFSVTTDDYGNLIEQKLIEQNVASPTLDIKILNMYDDKYNPYFNLPNFIDDTFFGQNNIIETKVIIDGIEEEATSSKSFQYSSSGLLTKLVDTFSQGTHTIEYVYDCK